MSGHETYVGPNPPGGLSRRRRDHRRVRPWHDPPQISEIRSSRDVRWLNRALRAAQGVDGRWKVGCVIVRGGRVLSVAVNSPRNDPSTVCDKVWCSSEHAEMAALRLAGEARGARAYVARIGNDGEVRHAQPCKRCREALEQAGVSAVWTSDPDYVASKTLNV